MAAREGGGDEAANPRLRSALLSARAANMPKDNIQRAIQKGVGGGEGQNYQEIIYEGYGPGGVAILVEALTDNRNRTAADVRSIFSKHGGNLGENGCVSYLFELCGVIDYDAAQYSEDDIIEVAIEAGAQDVVASAESIEVQCTPRELHDVAASIAQQGFTHRRAEVVRIPATTLTVGAGECHKALKLIELLDDHDDVREVATNLEIPDDYGLERS